jgi:uroporphyrinogen-III synthase
MPIQFIIGLVHTVVLVALALQNFLLKIRCFINNIISVFADEKFDWITTTSPEAAAVFLKGWE